MSVAVVVFEPSSDVSNTCAFFKDFFLCGPFLKPFFNLLQYCFCFMFCFVFLGQEACGVSAPRPGIKLALPCMGRQNLSHWTAKEVPPCAF